MAVVTSAAAVHEVGHEQVVELSHALSSVHSLVLLPIRAIRGLLGRYPGLRDLLLLLQVQRHLILLHGYGGLVDTCWHLCGIMLLNRLPKDYIQEVLCARVGVLVALLLPLVLLGQRWVNVRLVEFLESGRLLLVLTSATLCQVDQHGLWCCSLLMLRRHCGLFLMLAFRG